MNEAGRFKCGDVLRLKSNVGGFRVWRVTGIYLGGINQESVIEIENLDKIEDTQKSRLMIPYDILEEVKFYGD